MGKRRLVNQGTSLSRDEIVLLKFKANKLGFTPKEVDKKINNLKKHLKEELEMMRFKEKSIGAINQMREDLVQKAFMEFELEELE